MAELGGTRLGTMIAEIDLDARRYDAGLRAALQSAEMTTQSAGQAWRRLGTGSTESIDRMRANVVRSYETIRNSATSTAADIERAEAAARARLEQINRRYFGSLNTQMRQTVSESQSMANNMAAGFTRIHGVMLTVASAVTAIGTALVANSFLKTASEFEKFDTQLKTITGSSIKAQQAMSWIKDFAKTTPYEVGQVTEAFVKLQAYGLDSQKWMKTLGDTASSMGKGLEQSVEMFADAATGEFERLKEFGVKAKTEGDKVTFSWSQNGQDMVKSAVNTQAGITDALGQIFSRFDGGMEAMSQTWEGMTSNLIDHWEAFKLAVMSSGPFEAMKEGLREFLDYLDSNQGKMDLAQWAHDMAIGVLDAFELIIAGAETVMNSIASIRIAFGSTMKAYAGYQINRYENAITALSNTYSSTDSNGVLTVNIAAQQQAAKAIEEYQNKLKEANQTLTAANMMVEGNSKAIVDNGAKFAKLHGIIDKWQSAKKTEPQYIDSWLTGTNQQLDKTTNIANTASSAAKKASKAQSEANRAAREAAREAERAAKESLRIQEKFQDDYNKTILSSNDYAELKLKEEYRVYSEHVKDKVALEKWFIAEKKKIDDDRAKDSEKALKDYFDEIDDLHQDYTQDYKDALEEQKKAQEEALEEMQQAYEDFVYDVKYATSDMFMDLFEGGFSSMFDNIEAMFRRTLANLAAEAIAEPIIVPVIQSFAGTVGGTISSAMGIPTIAGQTSSGFNLLGNANTLYSAVSGGMETGVYNALTSGTLNSIGSGIFGAGAWGGTAVSTGALAAGGELGWGAANMAALGTGTGASGIAGSLAAAAPYLAGAAIAAPLIMKMLEDEPEPFLRVQTTSTSKELSNPDYKWADGEGKSLAGFDYNLTMQDIGGETQKELGAAIKTMLDAQFTAIEDTLNVSVNEAIVEAQNAGTGYGDGFFSKVDLRDYEDNIAGALQALTDDLFLDIRDNLTNQLTDGKSSIFNDDFFKGIAKEGETAVDTFLRFGKTLETNTNFMEDFTRRTSELGQTAAQAYNAIVAIEELGAAITGLSSASVANALWESIKAGQSASDFVATLENQVREGVAQATVNAFAESLYSAFLQPINVAIGQMVSSIVTGGITTGAALTASMATIRESLNLALEVLKNEDFKTLIADFTTELTSAIGSTPAIYTPPIIINTAVEEKQAASEKADETAADNAQKLLELMKSIKLSITDAGLSEYALALETIKRAAEESITNVTALGASEEQLAEIRQLETIQIKKTIKEWADDLKEYTRSFSNMSDVLSSTMESLDKAIESYAKFVESAEEMGTEPALRMASINAALAPVKDSFMSLFDEVFALSKSDIEIETNAIVSQTKGLVDAVEFLASQGVFALEGLDGFIDGIYAVGEKLVNAKKMSIYRDSLSSFGSTQAQIAGLSDEYNLMNLSNRYGTDFTDAKNRQEILNSLTYMQYDDVLKWSTEVGISIETLLEDMITLSDISSELSDSFKEVQETLDDYRKSLLTSDYSYLDPSKKTEIARQNLMSLSQQSLSSDPAIAQKAMNAMPAAAEELLRLSKASNTSMLDYNMDMALVLQSLNKAEAYAATYVDTTEDMTDEQDKALKELQRGHLQNISKTLNNLDKGMAAIFDDPELVKFFSDFSTIFGTGVMDSLTGNIDILDETIDEFTEKGILDLEELKALLITGLPLSESDRTLLQNMEIAWDGDAAIDFWASVAMDFQGTFEQAMGLLGFIYNTSDQSWNAPAVVGFIQCYDEWYKIGNITDIMAAIGFLGDEAGWESPALVSFVGNTSLWSKVPFEDAMRGLNFIFNKTNQDWEAPALVNFIQGYGGWNALTFEEKMGALNFLADTTDGGWESTAVLAFISNDSAFGTLTVTDALTALKMTADGSGGWATKATVSMMATMIASDTLAWADIIPKMKEYGAVDDTVYKTITAVVGEEWAGLLDSLKDYGFTNEQIGKTINAIIDNEWIGLKDSLVGYGFTTEEVKKTIGMIAVSDWEGLQTYLTSKGFVSEQVDKTINAVKKDWEGLKQYFIDNGFVSETVSKTIDAVKDSEWTGLKTALVGYGFTNEQVEKTIDAIIDSEWTGLKTALVGYGFTNEEVNKTINATLSGNLTTSEIQSILDSWGDKTSLTANVTGDITNTVNLASNTLLTEATFNDFAKAFLGISPVWKTLYPSLQISADSATGLYSVIDGLILVFDAIKNQQTTFPSSMQVTGSVTAVISSLPVGTNTYNPLYSYITNGVQISSMPYVNISSMPYVNISSMPYVNISSMPSLSLNTGNSSYNPLYVYMTNSAMQVYGEVSPYNWGAFGSSLYSGLTAINNNLKSISKGETAYASFASGGYHSGGLRLVGELGPELEFTGASRIMSNSDTKALFGSAFGGQNAMIVKELRKLREDIDRLNKINFQQLKAVTRQKKIFDKWDIDGTPPEREAVAA